MAKPLPSFLSVPLDNPSVFAQIVRTLAERERDRMLISAGNNQNHNGISALVSRRRITKSLRPQPSSPVSTTSSTTLDPTSPIPAYSVTVGTSPAHAKKNRYMDVVSYDRTRVLLPYDEYVNASLVHEPDLGFDERTTGIQRRTWVASQAPIQSTLHAFLALLLTPPTSSSIQVNSHKQPPVNVVIQLTPLQERNVPKCHPYFPLTVGQTWTVNSSTTTNTTEASAVKPIWIRLEDKEQVSQGHYRISRLTVGWEGDQVGRKVTHVEYLGWTDHGLPQSPRELLAFMDKANKVNDELSADSGVIAPILVHCSAGVGRTGTYIAISSLLPVLKHLIHHESSPPPPTPTSITSTNGRLSPYPSTQHAPDLPRDYVGETIDALRESRCMMVQTVAQIKFVFETLAYAWNNLSSIE